MLQQRLWEEKTGVGEIISTLVTGRVGAAGWTEVVVAYASLENLRVILESWAYRISPNVVGSRLPMASTAFS